MFFWSNKTKKSVTFNQGVADRCLLEVVKTELVRQPHKNFSNLCKEALWQFLCIPEAVRPNSGAEGTEQQVTELQRQLAEFEQRLLTKESLRLEAIERQLNQLTQQMTQLAMVVNQQLQFEPSSSYPPVESDSETVTPATYQEADPLLSRLSPFLEDF